MTKDKTNEALTVEQRDPYRAQVERARVLLTTDPARAVEELRTLAEQGSVTAMIQWGWACQTGTGTAVDMEQAAGWYRRAYEKGSGQGIWHLGNVYLGQKDYAQAREAFTAGAIAGDASCLDALRQLNIRQRWEAEPDGPRLQRATAALKTNPAWALNELRVLAEMGSPGSMMQLGGAYRLGTGTAVDWDTAITWYRRAQEKGDRQALDYIGWIYLLRKDYTKAHQALNAAAALDVAPALYTLGVLYRRGLGVPKQPDKARPLFERAAALGHLLAKRDLAIMLLFGHAGVRRIPEGARLYRSAMKELFRVLAQDPSSERASGQLSLFHKFCRRKA